VGLAELFEILPARPLLILQGPAAQERDNGALVAERLAELFPPRLRRPSA